jgi:hypothetical protein
VAEARRVYGADHVRIGERMDGAASLASDEAIDLGDRIADLAQRIQVAEYEMLCLIAEFDDRRAWAAAGFGSCAEWLAWRIGCKPNSARERVRAAHALERLPRTSAAMRAGTLSFSKVRALTRVATPENEEALLEFAHAGSATNLERVVRAWKALDDREELGLEQMRHRHRSFSVFVGDDGSYVVKGRLEPEVGAVLMRAIEAAGDALFRRDRATRAGWRGGEGEGGGEGGGRGGGEGGVDHRVQRQCAARGLDPDISPAQRRADAVGLLCERALAAGFDGLTSGSRAERYQVMLHVEPATLRAASESGRSELDGVRVCAETSRRMTCDASVVDIIGRSDGTGGRTTDPGRQAAGSRGRNGRARGDHVTAVTSEGPIPHSALPSKILGVGRRTRTIPPALRRALQTRDRGCRFPGCDCRITDAHHVRHWADGGRTDLRNLVLLCRRHHRAVHEGGMRVCLDAEGKVAFFTPAGRAVFDAPRGGMPRTDAPLRGIPRTDTDTQRGEMPRTDTPRRGLPRNPGPAPAPLPPAPPTTAAYPGADRWPHDRDIPWQIESRALEALDA